MNRSLLTLTLAIAIGAAVPGAALAKDVLLRFAPENQKLHYRMILQQEVFVQGLDIESNFEGNVDIEWLEKTDDGKSKLSVTFSNLEGTMRQGDNLTDQDLGINDVEVWVTVSETGRVDEVDPQAVLDEAKTSMVQDFIENLVLYMPEDKVGKGDSWVQERERDGATADDPPALKGRVEYWLDDFKKEDGREVAKVTGEGKADIHIMTPGGMLVGEAKGDVEFVIALDGGYMIKGKSTTEVKGEIGGQELSQVRRFECTLQ
jgi:hypothetical protein